MITVCFAFAFAPELPYTFETRFTTTHFLFAALSLCREDLVAPPTLLNTKLAWILPQVILKAEENSFGAHVLHDALVLLDFYFTPFYTHSG